MKAGQSSQSHWMTRSTGVLNKSKKAADGKVHLSEPAIDTCQLSLRVKLEVKYKIVQKFARPGDTLATAFRRMVDECVADVRLSPESLQAVRDEMAANRERRDVRRLVNFGDRVRKSKLTDLRGRGTK